LLHLRPKMKAIMKSELWNPNYIKVLFTNFTISFSFYLLTPLLPLYLSENFGATKDVIGLVLSGYTMAALLVRPFSGYLADSFPRRKVLLISLSLYFIFFGSYLLASSLLAFFLVRTLHGGPYGATTVANNTAAIDVVTSARRNEAVGYYGLSNNIATAIAPTVGVLVYSGTHNFNLLFWMALAIAGLGLAVDSTVKFPDKQPIKDKKAISLDRFFLTKGWMIGLNVAFFGLCYGVLSNYLAIYGKEKMGITGGTGTYFMLLAIGLILSRLQGVKKLRGGNLARNAGEGILVSTVGYALFVLWPGPVGYYGSALLIGLGNGHLWPAMQNMMVSVAHNNERGTATSTMLTSWDLGIGLGVLMGGAVSEYFSYEASFATVAAVHFLGAMLFFLATRKFFESRRLDLE